MALFKECINLLSSYPPHHHQSLHNLPSSPNLPPLYLVSNRTAPARFTRTNYFVQLDDEACVNCEACVDRCPMEAISTGDETVSGELPRCIGGGLFVATYPSNALKIIAKPGDGKREFVPGKYRFMRSSLNFENDMDRYL